MYEFKLPDLGEGIAEGEILKWHVEVGQEVAEDAPLIDVETDKAAVNIPSPRGGKVVSLNGKIGDVVNVGAVVVVIDDGAGDEIAPAAAETRAPAPTAAPVAATAPLAAAVPAGKHRPVPAAPATRRLAREVGVDIDRVPASGPAGRVTPEDVHAFHAGGGAAAPTTTAAPEAHVPAKAVHDDRAFAEFAAHAASTIPFLELEPMPDALKTDATLVFEEPYPPMAPTAGNRALLALLNAFLLWRAAMAEGRDARPFVLTLCFFALGFAGLVLGIWPNIVPPSLSIWQAASPPSSPCPLTPCSTFWTASWP